MPDIMIARAICSLPLYTYIHTYTFEAHAKTRLLSRGNEFSYRARWPKPTLERARESERERARESERERKRERERARERESERERERERDLLSRDALDTASMTATSMELRQRKLILMIK